MTRDEALAVSDRVRTYLLSWTFAGPFGWPDDIFSNERWFYDFHSAWVKAWNQTGRITNVRDFLYAWSDAENIMLADASRRGKEGG